MKKLNQYRPDLYRNRLTDVTTDDLRSLGVRAAAIDADNTSGYDGTDRPLPGSAEWAAGMREAGFPVVLLTNASRKRAEQLGACCGIPVVSLANKPNPKGYRRAAEAVGCAPEELVMIGDQLLTDIRGANRAGCRSVFVRPYEKEKRLRIHFTVRRFRERLLLRALTRQDGDRNRTSRKGTEE